MTPTDWLLIAGFVAAAVAVDRLSHRWMTRPLRTASRSADEQYARECLTADERIRLEVEPDRWEGEMHELMHDLAEEGADWLTYERHHKGRVYLLPKERKVAR